jgi:RND superfamily putative drug exporter
VLGVIAIIFIAGAAGSAFNDKFQSGNSASAQVQSILHARFPAQAGDTADVVFHTTDPLSSPANRARIDQVSKALRPLAHVSSITGPFDANAHGQVSNDGHIGFSVIQFDTTADNLSKKTVQHVVNTAKTFAQPGFGVTLGGNPIEKIITVSPGSSEGIGITAAIIIMLVAFGSVVAMGLPILTALVGVGIGYGLIDLVSQALVVPSFGPQMMAMIGLGVGIDYALFIVTRYRQGLADGRPPRNAVIVAHGTAGRAVLFAGTTVIISLLGLFIVGLAFMNGLAVGCILAVLMVLGAALTLLPSMLGFAGHAIDRLRLPKVGQRAHAAGHQGFWWRWSRTVQRRPWVTGFSGLLVLVVLALPLFSMRLQFTDASNDPTNQTTRQAYDLLSAGFGPGFNGPLVIAATLSGPQDRATVAALDAQLRTVPGIASVAPAQLNPTGNAAVIIAYPTTSPQSAATSSLVNHLRHQVIPAVTANTGMKALVGGETAAGIDASSYLSGRLPWVIALVVFLAFVLLMSVFRSLAIAIKAAILNLISIGAAYGVIVAVYQWGWASSVFGVSRTGPIDPWIPVMMFTITFGLSMDYEVFLLSRIREEWLRQKDNSLAVADGLASTARVITAAALIMVCVFGSFVIGDPLRVLNVFGLGLAAAIFVDATVVRMVVVPSIMQLLGRANWWLPSWIDRILPTIGVEAQVGPVPEAGPEPQPARV